MSVFGPNQVEELFIGNAVAAETTAATFIASASDKELKLVGSDGAAIALGSNFKVLQKTAGSAAKNLNFEFSDIVEADSVKAVNLGVFSAEVPKQVTVSGFTGNETANATYEVFIKIVEDGGSLSAENFRFLYGSFVSGSTAPTAGAICDGIVETLQAAADASNPGEFLITKEAGDVVQILAVVQPANIGKESSRPTYFDVQAKAVSNGNDPATGLPTVYDFVVVTVDAESHPGVGTGKYVAQLEWFAKGYKYEPYREVSYPANFNTPYYADQSKNYNVIHIGYFKQRNSTIVERQYKVISIAVEYTDLASNAATNAVLADLRTILGTAAVPADLAVV